MSVCLRLSPIAAIILTLSIAGSAFAQDKPTRVRGEIVSLDGSMMTVKSIDGSDMKIKLPDNVGISGVVPFRIEEIKPNSYIGVSSIPQPDGTERAIHVLSLIHISQGIVR